MSEASEKLLKNQVEVEKQFNMYMADNKPDKAQAVAVLGVFSAINTIARMIIHAEMGDLDSLL